MGSLYLYLGITGVVWLSIGLRALVQPEANVAIPNGLQILDVDGRNYLRSGTGGVTIAGSLLFFAAIAYPKLAFPAVVMAVVVLGGLVFGRLYSLIVDGSPGMVPWVSGVFELIGLLFSLFWLYILSTV